MDVVDKNKHLLPQTGIRLLNCRKILDALSIKDREKYDNLARKSKQRAALLIRHIISSYNRKSTSKFQREITPNWNRANSRRFNIHCYYRTFDSKAEFSIFVESVGGKNDIRQNFVEYILFFSRKIPKHEKLEIWALATRGGRHALSLYSDYQFPIAIAKKVMESEIREIAFHYPFGRNISGAQRRRDTHPDSKLEMLDKIQTKIKSTIKPKSSLFGIPSLRQSESTTNIPKIAIEIKNNSVTIGRRLDGCTTLPEILYIFSKIVRGKTTRECKIDDKGCYVINDKGVIVKGAQERDDASLNYWNLTKQVNDPEAKKQLEQRVKEAIFIAFKNETPLSFDFYHKNCEDYFQAATFKLVAASKLQKRKCIWKVPENADDMLAIVRERIKIIRNCKNFESFWNDLDQVSVSFSSKNGKTKKDKFRNFFHGEIMDENGNRFFKIAGQFYEMTIDLLHMVNQEFVSMLRAGYLMTPLRHKWPSDQHVQQRKESLKKRNEEKGTKKRYDVEGEYNRKYDMDTDCLVGDKILTNGIELFDLLFVKDGKVEVVHVKKGFDHHTRIGVSQLRNSADLLSANANLCLTRFNAELEKSESVSRMKARQQLEKLGGIEKLIKLFEERQNVCFVYAFAIDGNRRLENDHDAFQSTIAQMEMLHAKQTIESRGFQFKICQLDKEPYVPISRANEMPGRYQTKNRSQPGSTGADPIRKQLRIDDFYKIGQLLMGPSAATRFIKNLLKFCKSKIILLKSTAFCSEFCRKGTAIRAPI